MKIVCFPHFYYLSEVSRLIEIGKQLRRLGQEVIFFSHGGPYETIVRDEGFELVSITPTMSPEGESSIDADAVVDAITRCLRGA